MSEPLAGRRILVLVGDIYEDLELWYPKLRLIEAGITLGTFSVEGESLSVDTAAHLETLRAAVEELGSTPHHRQTFLGLQLDLF